VAVHVLRYWRQQADICEAPGDFYVVSTSEQPAERPQLSTEEPAPRLADHALVIMLPMSAGVSAVAQTLRSVLRECRS
jgi:hypothetical protein